MEKRKTKILIVAAMKQEVELLIRGTEPIDIIPEGLQVSNNVKRACVPYWEPDRFEGQVAIFCCGVGGKKATRSMRHLLSMIAPEKILVIGFSGSLTEMIDVGNFILVTSVSHHSKSMSPDLFDEQWTESIGATLSSMATDFHRGTAACSDKMVDTLNYRTFLQESLNAICVDMESFYLLKVAETENVPVAMLRIVSDNADESLGVNFDAIPRKRRLRWLYYLKHPRQYIALRRLLKTTQILAVKLNHTTENLLKTCLQYKA